MVKVSALEFMSNNPSRKRVSILEPLRDDIFKLKCAGYSISQILEFLSANDVIVSKTALVSFIRVRTRASSIDSYKNDQAATTRPDSMPTIVDQDPATMHCSIESKNEKQKLVERHGRVIDVNYKPSWVDEDINLADLI